MKYFFGNCSQTKIYLTSYINVFLSWAICCKLFVVAVLCLVQHGAPCQRISLRNPASITAGKNKRLICCLLILCRAHFPRLQFIYFMARDSLCLSFYESEIQCANRMIFLTHKSYIAFYLA